jgi:ribulose-bisphosphate carboxylase large chain
LHRDAGLLLGAIGAANPADLCGPAIGRLHHEAGGGIMAHPDGPAAGVRSMHEAWDAAITGIPLEEHARNHPDLARALEIAA